MHNHINLPEQYAIIGNLTRQTRVEINRLLVYEAGYFWLNYY